jgi:hypothetical protein
MDIQSLKLKIVEIIDTKVGIDIPYKNMCKISVMLPNTLMVVLCVDWYLVPEPHRSLRKNEICI